ncbi:MAG TPA: hypothetical protein VLA81_05305 [Burkholderiales bacterium]|nr:hypothetical protein [Burkholderiales bacterium]
MLAQGEEKGGGTRDIDLDEVARLVEALERDLAKLPGGSQDVQRLRDEVETLKNVLNSPIRRHHWVSDSLHGMRTVLEEAIDAAVARGLKTGQYISEIGRILGL